MYVNKTIDTEERTEKKSAHWWKDDYRKNNAFGNLHISHLSIFILEYASSKLRHRSFIRSEARRESTAIPNKILIEIAYSKSVHGFQNRRLVYLYRQ
jgi:hypothetical protein